MAKKTRLQLQAERMIAKHGSIRRAALHMGLTHSTVLRYKTGVIKIIDPAMKKFLNEQVGP